MNSNTSSKLKLIVSMAVFGTLGLFTRNISVTSGELALYRAVLVSTVILGEAMTAMQALGGVLILGFTLLNELKPGKEK